MSGALDAGDLGNNIRVIRNGEKRMKMATHALQLLFHGFTGFCWPIAFYATDNVDSAELASIVWEACSILGDFGFTIDYVMTDGASSNRGLFNLLCHGDARQASYISVDAFDVSHSIYLVQDPKHCIKKIRNSDE